MESVLSLRACSNSWNSFRPVGAETIEQLEKYGAIFKRAIHALAEEGHDGVSGVAEQQDFSIHVPGRAFDGDHRADRIRRVIFLELRHQRNRVRKSLLEKVLRFFTGVEARKTFAAFERQK